jgi:hypothetical protein
MVSYDIASNGKTEKKNLKGKEEREAIMKQIDKLLAFQSTDVFQDKQHYAREVEYSKFNTFLRSLRDKLSVCDNRAIWSLKLNRYIVKNRCDKRQMCLSCGERSDMTERYTKKLLERFNTDRYTYSFMTFTLPNSSDPSALLHFIKWINLIKKQKANLGGKAKGQFGYLSEAEMFMWKYEIVPTQNKKNSYRTTAEDVVGKVTLKNGFYYNHHVHVTLIHKKGSDIENRLIESWDDFCKKEFGELCSVEKDGYNDIGVNEYRLIEYISLGYSLGNPAEKLFTDSKSRIDVNNREHLNLLIIQQYWLEMFSGEAIDKLRPKSQRTAHRRRKRILKLRKEYAEERGVKSFNDEILVFDDDSLFNPKTNKPYAVRLQGQFWGRNAPLLSKSLVSRKVKFLAPRYKSNSRSFSFEKFLIKYRKEQELEENHKG